MIHNCTFKDGRAESQRGRVLLGEGDGQLVFLSDVRRLDGVFVPSGTRQTPRPPVGSVLPSTVTTAPSVKGVQVTLT